MRLWAVLVTRGAIIEYPPELYASEQRAIREAGRWAWIVAGHGDMRIKRPFWGRWEVGTRDIRLVGCPYEERQGLSDPWVGSYWDIARYAASEAVVLDGEQQARSWVTAAGGKLPTRYIEESAWGMSAVFGAPGDESIAMALRAKFVVDSQVTPDGAPSHEVDLASTFMQRGRVSGSRILDINREARQ